MADDSLYEEYGKDHLRKPFLSQDIFSNLKIRKYFRGNIFLFCVQKSPEYHTGDFFASWNTVLLMFPKKRRKYEEKKTAKFGNASHNSIDHIRRYFRNWIYQRLVS